MTIPSASVPTPPAPIPSPIAASPPPSGPAPKPAPIPAHSPTAVPDHAFEESVAGEEDPGASLDNHANGVPPPKGRDTGHP